MAIPRVSKDLGFFRFRATGDRTVITNQAGDFEILTSDEFHRFIQGKLGPEDPLRVSLHAKGFIANEKANARIADKLRSRFAAIRGGTALHIVIPTLRCNQSCVYCHASAVAANEKSFDMTPETAAKVVDTVFQTPSGGVTIEFQGGEPLLNWEAVRGVVEGSIERSRSSGKDLVLTAVSNFTALTEEKLDYLIEKKVGLCTSLDGPREIHDRFRGAGTHDRVHHWLQRAGQAYAARYPLYRPAALTTVTRPALDHPESVVDEYLRLGMEGIHLRNLNPYGFGREQWKIVGYSIDEFMRFYRRAMEHILTINRSGTLFMERTAVIFLTKILTDRDPNFMELRSPCGASIGQIAYNYNGNVYTCDEGRMLSMMGDDAFLVGNVHRDRLADMVGHPTTRSMTLASTLDGQPGCSTCAYNPYCGICPILNYCEQGNIFGRQRENEKCRLTMAVCDFLFEKMQDPSTLRMFNEWIETGARL